MKTIRVDYYDDDDFEIYNDGDNRYERPRKKKVHLVPDERRRPVKNWKKVWSDRGADYDEIDDFYEKTK